MCASGSRFFAENGFGEFDDVFLVVYEKAIPWFWLNNLAAGEAAEGGEGKNIVSEVKAGHSQSGAFSIRDFYDGMQMPADIEVASRCVFWFVDDTDFL